MFGTGSDFSLLECFTLRLCYPLCFYYAVNMLEQLDSAILMLSYNTLLGLSRQSSIPFELHVFKTRLPKATLKSLYTSVYRKICAAQMCIPVISKLYNGVSFSFLAISWYRIFKEYFKAKCLHPDRLKYCIQSKHLIQHREQILTNCVQNVVKGFIIKSSLMSLAWFGLNVWMKFYCDVRLARITSL